MDKVIYYPLLRERVLCLIFFLLSFITQSDRTIMEFSLVEVYKTLLGRELQWLLHIKL
ncbi:hypothetical protein [Pseudomonas phage PhiPizzaParty]|nr:hypothetical protein [Pseudomonas phage PhiPizzaParty]